MSSVTDEITQQLENGPIDRDLVASELDAILSSQFFRGSKRYPALLKYVVLKTLEGHTEDLKERTLGIEVFHRSPSYDTNADPVVRSSASEVRKRLAQYYRIQGRNSPLQIELPLGSYVPEFKPTSVPDSVDVPLGTPAVRSRRLIWWVAAGLVGALLALGAYELHKSSPPNVAEILWGPLLRDPRAVLIVVGTSDFGETHERPPDAGSTDRLRSPYHHVSMSCALALARVAGFLQANGKDYIIKDDREVSLTDFRSRPVVLIGGRNNPWTVRLTEPLRLHFDYGSLSKVEDGTNPSGLHWGGQSTPGSDSEDYAIFARYHDTITDGEVMVLAGLGTFGTESASEFAVSSQYIDQVRTQRPADWEKKNLELVIKTEDISGEAGPPHIVSSAAW